jgi:hypothetical protein
MKPLYGTLVAAAILASILFAYGVLFTGHALQWIAICGPILATLAIIMYFLKKRDSEK